MMLDNLLFSFTLLELPFQGNVLQGGLLLPLSKQDTCLSHCGSSSCRSALQLQALSDTILSLVSLPCPPWSLNVTVLVPLASMCIAP